MIYCVELSTGFMGKRLSLGVGELDSGVVVN